MPAFRSSPIEAEPTVNGFLSLGRRGRTANVERDAGSPVEPAGAEEVDERTIVRLLASGRQTAVHAALAERGCRDLLALVAETDARARNLAIDPPDVEVVMAQVESEEPPDSPLRVWCQAILAERLLLDFDEAALDVTRRVGDRLDGRRPPAPHPLTVRYALARLRRVEALLELLGPRPLGDTDSAADQRSTRDLVVSELLACGLVDEVHVTRGLVAGLTAACVEEDVVESYDRLLDARDALTMGPESLWPGVLDTLLAIVAFEVGDVAASLDALDRIEQMPLRHPRLDAVVDYGRAFFRLVTSGASPGSLTGVEDALATARRRDPRFAQMWHGHVAKTLADMGHPACAHFVRLEAELPVSCRRHQLDRDVLRLRVAVLEGIAVSPEQALGRLGRLDAIGHRRGAGRAALRLAHDLARVGAEEAAQQVHAWGRDRVPSGDRATIWESWWSRPVGPTSVGEGDRRAVSTAALALRVMAPSLEVTLDGVVVRVGAKAARLLVALVLAHPTPLHVEQASDLLWPGETLARTRHRLNTVVHRLRCTLGAHRDAVMRTGDLLGLDPDRCDVDLWRFRRASAGTGTGAGAGAGASDDDRRSALVDVAGSLCDAQFPYDETFVEARHRIRSEWQRQARAAARSGLVDPAHLHAPLAAMGLTPDDL